MAVTPLEPIPTLKGIKAAEFVEKADSSRRKEIKISDLEKEIYLFLIQKNSLK
ncbi:hypothetical protein LEP1GSC047_2104 [Leptospira inadai serovar Lyme str. 10]|uniref:Uncharacterized protein n=1 Tax=Leptospira inadai serovar Lyme str. 10 TaxID=1049790 RepID=V6HPA4_9LEPT|nr:hypothetical protein [Leptospira inadai]EQA38715.1 hypothetical protein LEP1GSC047_2104 [Leptospira inadai serovar Lyme str. 10]